MTEAERPSLLVVNQYAMLPSDGGGTRHFELGRELVRRGWKVTIVASDFHMHRRTYTRRASVNDRAPVSETLDGVEMRWVWAAPYARNDWRRAWNWLSFSRSVWKYRRSISRPDVVIGSSPQPFAANAGRRIAASFSTPLVFEVRDLYPESLVAAGGRKGPGYHALGYVVSKLYRDANRILVLAQGTADYLIGRGMAPQKFIYIPNGVDVGTVHAPETGRHTGGPFTFLYAGAHGPANGLSTLLDAAEMLGPDAGVRFVLIGDGIMKEGLRADAAARRLTNVEFRDSVSKPKLVDVFAEADVGLMLLREAPLFSFAVSPNKLFDYLAAELPVVCNVPGDVARMIEESKSGVQARDSGAAALVEAIRSMRACTPDERRAMGRTGRQWVIKEHSREVLGERLNKALRELIAR